jgi:hypothetical protein
MARYCANERCIQSTHPLPETGGPCPKCGGVKFRLKPDVATIGCPTCNTRNVVRSAACWVCGATLNQHRAIR